MNKKALSFILFAISFAFIESVVVIYLRALYYPDGFDFPLKLMTFEILQIEVMREIATIVLLISVAYISGKNFYKRLAWFLIGFGIWDIFYYVWLKTLIGWPDSFFTWDILFLIPLSWTGPVLAPILCSLTMIFLGILMISLEKTGKALYFSFLEWSLMISATIIIFLTFVWDYMQMIASCESCKISDLLENEEFIEFSTSYVPEAYHWDMFIFGEILILFSIYIFVKRIKKAV